MQVLEATSSNVDCRVVLIDDEGAEDGVGILREIAEVVVYEDPLEAVACIEPDSCDYIIADLLMPGLSGSEVLEELMNKGVKCPMSVRSSFLDSAEVSNRPFFSDHGISVFDRQIVSSPTFYREIRRLVGGQGKPTSQLASNAEDETATSVLDMPYAEFRELDQTARYLFQQRTKKSLAKEIDVAFKSGAVWFLYGGRKGGHLVINDYAELPTRAKINEFCEERNIPVLQYFKGAEIDDVLLGWNEDCNDSTQHYPLLGFSGTGAQEDTIPIHFDTGSPVSFADHDILKGIVPHLDSREDVDWVDFTINGEKIKVTHEPVSLFLMDIGGATPRVSVTFIVPELWTRFPNRQRVCGDSCDRENDDGSIACLSGYGKHKHEDEIRFYCRYRWGLVGRKFVIDNKLSLVLDGKNRQLRLYRE